MKKSKTTRRIFFWLHVFTSLMLVFNMSLAGVLFSSTAAIAESEEGEYATIKAYKVVCDSEDLLPNWHGQGDITADTAADFVAETEGCDWIDEDWDFEWGNRELSYPGDSLDYASNNEDDWFLFEPASNWSAPAETVIDLNDDGLGDGNGKIWFREVLKDGYKPYSIPPGDLPGSDVSAEFYCDIDVEHYDNMEEMSLSDLEAGGTYYCVAFNVLEEQGPECGDAVCNGDENCENCSQDCGNCEEPACVEEAGWADIASDDTAQGTLKNGSAITDPARIDAAKALGENDGKFFSLGKDGFMVAEFSRPVENVAGDDLYIYEITNGRSTYPEEKAQIEVSQNGSDWAIAGMAGSKDNGTGISGLDFGASGYDWIKFVRISDMTDFAPHRNDADGYDLDAIKAANLLCEIPEDPTGSITVCKYDDANNDGDIEGDGKLAGWEMNLYTCPFIADRMVVAAISDEVLPGACTLFDSQLTEEDGCYTWTDLEAGSYKVTETMPLTDDWTQTFISNADAFWLDASQSEHATVNIANYQEPDLPSGCEGYKTYTTDADFNEGTLINLSQNPANQLQLDETVTPFGFIWVSVSSQGTIVKINTETGAVMGEYRTSPNGTFGNPSRTTVDKDGSVWVGNRQSVINGYAAITHVGLMENGQCEDRNGNGIIDTSTGFGDVKDWTNASGDRGVATAQDECIVHFTQVSGSDARHISVDPDNNVWVSGVSTRTFELVKGGKYDISGSGQILRTENGIGYGGYGGLISGDVIWSANQLLRWDTNYALSDTEHRQTYSHDSYGLCKDSQGNVWNTSLSEGVVRKFAPNGDIIGTFSHGGSYAQGCVVDGNDHVWVAHSLWGNSIGHLLNDGTLVGVVPVGSGPTGVAVDNNGKIWTTHYSSNDVMRIDPSLGAIGGGGFAIGAVDLNTGSLGGSLYNYSDMTGSALTGQANNGTWTVIRDSGVAGYSWDGINWTAANPGDSTLAVSVASSEDGTTWSAPQSVSNGASLSGISSRYLKISVNFIRSSEGQSPILYDLTLDQSCRGDEPVRGCTDSSATNYNADATEDDGSCSYRQSSSSSSSGGLLFPTFRTGTPISQPETPVVLGEEGAPVLALAKKVDRVFANPGDKDVMYTLTVSNSGTLTAFNVEIKDVLPAGLAYADNGAAERTWTVGDLNAGESKEFYYKVNIAANAAAGHLANTAVASADNHADVSAGADLEIRAIAVLAATGFDAGEFLLLLSGLLLAVLSALGLRRRLA